MRITKPLKGTTVVATITHHDTKINTSLSITTLYRTFYYNRDDQGSIVALSDEYGQIIEHRKRADNSRIVMEKLLSLAQLNEKS